jgi:hypothetical protein
MHMAGITAEDELPQAAARAVLLDAETEDARGGVHQNLRCSPAGERSFVVAMRKERTFLTDTTAE